MAKELNGMYKNTLDCLKQVWGLLRTKGHEEINWYT